MRVKSNHAARSARRLEIAYRALQQYPIRPVLVTFLQHSENLTFRVDCAEAVFLLRLHSPRTPAFGAHRQRPAGD